MRFVDVSQDEQTFWNLPEGLQCLIQGVLFRVRVEAAKDIGRGRFLELNGGDKAQNIVPARDDAVGIPIGVRLDGPRRLIDVLAAAEKYTAVTA